DGLPRTLQETKDSGGRGMEREEEPGPVPFHPSSLLSQLSPEDDLPPSGGHHDVGPDPTVKGEPVAGGPAGGGVGGVVDSVGHCPGECWMALEALARVEPGVLGAIIAELAGHQSRPGVSRLLQLLGATRDAGTRTAARRALEGPVEPTLALFDPPEGSE